METKYINIKYLNKEVSILQYLSESNSQFNERLEYIKLLENASVDWKETVRLSKIWHCIKYKKCRYTPEIYHKVMSYEKK
jgi:hypothetical protein